MKIECPQCKYIFEIEDGYEDESEDVVSCPNCNKDIIVNEKDNIEYIDTSKWENNKVIEVSLKSIKLRCIAISLIGIGIFGLFPIGKNSFVFTGIGNIDICFIYYFNPASILSMFHICLYKQK
jgi:uncharacterized protein YbaR (Trm112 family)